jgi:putative transposase
MPDFRRFFVAGGTYFFTLVTANRAPLFAQAEGRAMLGRKMRAQGVKTPFSTVAIVLMPDHLHAIWTLPAEDDDYPSRWQAIKAMFAHEWLQRGGREHRVSPGYGIQRRRGVWQPRYMEHVIDDEQDLQHHADYIHYNPVKHGYVGSPRQWPWSSFHRYVLSGEYPEGWGSNDQPPPAFPGVDEELLE